MESKEHKPSNCEIRERETQENAEEIWKRDKKGQWIKISKDRSVNNAYYQILDYSTLKSKPIIVHGMRMLYENIEYALGNSILSQKQQSECVF